MNILKLNIYDSNPIKIHVFKITMKIRTELVQIMSNKLNKYQ